jgi:hypothetical protein
LGQPVSTNRLTAIGLSPLSPTSAPSGRIFFEEILEQFQQKCAAVLRPELRKSNT